MASLRSTRSIHPLRFGSALGLTGLLLAVSVRAANARRDRTRSKSATDDALERRSRSKQQPVPTADVAKAVGLVKKLRLFPPADAANPPDPRYIDMAGKLFDGMVRYDASFYTRLARMVDEEPVQTRDLAMMGQLRNKAFRPGDAAHRLHVPANVPAAQFWSMTVYDLDTAGFLRGAPAKDGLPSFDFYGPGLALPEKTWAVGDIEALR